MYKTLIKKQLTELFQSYFVDKKTGKARGKGSTAAFFVLLGVIFVFILFAFYAMASDICATTVEAHCEWLYFAVFSILAIALGLFGSVFSTYASVYLPKDNELLMSLPIPNRTLVAARLTGVIGTSFVYSALIWLPTCLAYWTHAPQSTLTILFPILLFAVLALFVSVLSCLLGWVVALASAKSKGKSFFKLFFSIVFFVLYYVFYFKFTDWLGELTSHLDTVAASIKKWLYYFYLIGESASGSIPAMLTVTLITVALSLLCFWGMSKTFGTLALSQSSSAQSKQIRKDGYKQTSPDNALLKREYKHFSSIATWMLNGGLGILVLPAAAIAFLIKRSAVLSVIASVRESLSGSGNPLPLVILTLVCAVVSIDAILPVSVSLEGRSIWLLQSLPIDPWTILKSKLRMGAHLNLIPSIIFIVICSAAGGCSLVSSLLSLSAAMLFILFMSAFGLRLNLKRPDFNWKNEAMVTKQSMPVIAYLFSGWGISFLIGLTGTALSLFLGEIVALLFCNIVFGLLWFFLRRWIKTKGCILFAEL